MCKALSHFCIKVVLTWQKTDINDITSTRKSQAWFVRKCTTHVPRALILPRPFSSAFSFMVNVIYDSCLLKSEDDPGQIKMLKEYSK